MAKGLKDAPLPTVRGRIGNVVYKHYRKKKTIVVTIVPDMDGIKPSPAQQKQRQRMGQASRWAKRARGKPEMLAFYTGVAGARDDGSQIDNLMVSDYMRPPKILTVDHVGYRGQVGDAIRVRTYDEFGVVRVHIAIEQCVEGDQPTWKAVEQGDAEEADDWWVYRGQTEAPLGTVRILVSAWDRPSNCAQRMITKAITADPEAVDEGTVVDLPVSEYAGLVVAPGSRGKKAKRRRVRNAGG